MQIQNAKTKNTFFKKKLYFAIRSYIMLNRFLMLNIQKILCININADIKFDHKYSKKQW